MVAGALTAVAGLAPTPAAAAVYDIRNEYRAVNAEVTECALTAPVGSSCSRFFLAVTHARNIDGVVTKSFSVTAGRTLVTGPGGVGTTGILSQGSTTTGTITVAGSGKSARVKFTVDLVCFVPSCPLSGPHTFSLAFKRGTGSYTLDKFVYVSDIPACVGKGINQEANLSAPAGIGSVKAAGVRTSLRVVPDPLDELRWSLSTFKGKGTLCLF